MENIPGKHVQVGSSWFQKLVNQIFPGFVYGSHSYAAFSHQNLFSNFYHFLKYPFLKGLDCYSSSFSERLCSDVHPTPRLGEEPKATRPSRNMNLFKLDPRVALRLPEDDGRGETHSTANHTPKTFFLLATGVSVLSFAIVGPLFLLFIIYSFELGEVFIIKNALEASVREGARFGIVQDPQPGIDRLTAIQAKVREVARDASGGLINPNSSDFVISIKSYGNLALIEQPEPFVDANSNGIKDPLETFTDVNGNGAYDEDQGSAGAGGDGSAVIYEISYKFHSVAPLFNTYMADMTISARTVVVNDLFKVN